jgi:hypothetical protein
MSNLSKYLQTRGRGKGVGSNWGGMWLDSHQLAKLKEMNETIDRLDAGSIRFKSVNGKIVPGSTQIRIRRRQGNNED